MPTPASIDSTPTRSRQPRRQLSRLIVLVLLTLAAGVGLAGPASAHNVLTSSDPTDGSTLQAAPTTVRLTFDQPVQDFEPVVTVIGPDGQRYESGTPVVDSTVVTAGVNALPVAGAYTIAYRVVSADGHPVQGEIKFELTAAAISAATPVGSPAGAGTSGAALASAGSTPTSPADASPVAATSVAASGPVASNSDIAVAPTASSSGLSGWVWAAIVLALVLVAAAVVVIVRRPRQPE